MTIEELINSFPYPTTQSSYSDLLKEGSYQMYEFRDKEVEIGQDIYDEPYTKSISPLYTNAVINSESNQELLDIITEEIPYYYLEPSLQRDIDDTVFLSTVRDAGMNDVPYPLQTDFWSVWFRESQSDVQNTILLDVFNKLRFPFVNENQYLNATIFPDLAMKAYGETGDPGSLIEFKSTAEDNLADINEGNRGCVGYLNDIIDQKLDSTYAILNYNPDQSVLLTDWCESLYQSGMLDETEIDSEKSIFKLQDLKYELIRRKFAGSSTLYKLTLSSIDRQGSFVGVVPAGRLTNNYELFKDRRFIRLLNIPGILSQRADLSDNHPIDVFYERPLEDNENYIPLGTLVPLFYTSSPQTHFNADGSSYIDMPFDPEYFYLTGGQPTTPTGDEIYDYRNIYMRENNSVVEWNSLSGILSSDAINTFTPRLDEMPNGEYRKLDTDYTDSTGVSFPLKLDIMTPLVSASAVVGNMLDINADHLLYHRNILQEQLGDLYEFLTYPVANDNSVSLMDTSWIEYLESATKQKSRVQDQVYYGTQVNKYQLLTDPQTADYFYFGISYNDTDDQSVLYTYDELIDAGKTPRYAYIWFISINYDIATYLISPSDLRSTRTLAAKITLKLDHTYDDRFGNLDSYRDLQSYNMGMLPITYDGMKGDTLGALRLGLYEDATGEMDFLDDIEDLDYSKAMFLFSDFDILSDRSNFKSGSSEGSTEIGNDPLNMGYPFTQLPTSNTKTVYYSIRRIVDNEYTYSWSEPIRVIPINNSIIENQRGIMFRPDWYQLVYHLNPYLNFTENSASALRHREVILSHQAENLDLNEESKNLFREGPSEYAGLSSLSCTRGMDYTCNNTGEVPTDFTKPGGSFLERTKAPLDDFTYSQMSREYAKIWGDNRTEDLYDSASETTTSNTINRSDIYKDDHSIPCIYLEKGNPDQAPISGYEKIANNFLHIEPFNTQEYRSTISDDEYNNIRYNWSWNAPNDGITVCTNIRFTNINPGETFLIGREKDGDGVNSEFSLVFINDEGIDNSDNDNKKGRFRFNYYPTGTKNYAWSVDSDDLNTSNNADYVQNIDNIYSRNFRISGSAYVISSSIYNEIQLTLMVDSKSYTKRIYVKRNEDKTFEVGEIAIKIENGIPTNAFTPYENDTINENLNGFGYRDDSIYGYTEETFIPGYPAKYRIGDDLEGIELFSKHYEDENNEIVQTNMFYGYVYDVRLYNVGMAPEALYIHNCGLVREQYSYSPTSYKLGYSVCVDLGVFKWRRGIPVETGVIPDVNSVRLFNRSVWDSIMVDMFPNSAEEMTTGNPQYKEDYLDPKDDTDVYADENNLKAIEQELIERIEVINNTNPLESAGAGRVQVLYNNELINIDQNDHVSVITVSMYPVYYRNNLFNSYAIIEGYTDETMPSGNLSLSTLEDNNVQIPAHAVGNTLRYSSDLSVNFNIDVKSDLSVYYSKGTNIELCYNNSLQKSAIRLYDPSVKGANNNHVLIPFTLPEQPQGLTGNGSLDRFILNGVQFNQGIATLLKATSYYNEVRIPIAIRDSLGSSPRLISKWDAIRTLREGTYYFTVKYPIQILPFMDYEFNTKAASKYNTLYASARFKIEVKGSPKKYVYNENEEGYLNNTLIEGYPSQYTRSNYASTLQNGKSMWNPEDNRTFPHRYIDIDLYVMDSPTVVGEMIGDVENYTFWWTKIASNHDSNVQSVSDIADTLVYDGDIPLFLTKNYTSAFFISEYNRASESYDPASSDDDTITPIELRTFYSNTNLEAENLLVNEEDDLDKIVLIMGKSYKLLWDYDGKITEISYTDKYFEEETITDDEKLNYCRMTSLLNSNNLSASDYLYNGSVGWSNKSQLYIETKTSGYCTYEDSDGTEKWRAVLANNDSDFTYFGNPYSRSSNQNYLLKLYNNYRDEIDNLAYFPYLCEEYPTSSYLSASYMTTIPTVDNRGSSVTYTVSNLTLNESTILSSLWSSVKGRVDSALNSLRTNGSGLFTHLSEIRPWWQIFNSGVSDPVEPRIKCLVMSADYDLYAYYADDRSLSSRNSNINIVRRGVYSNNLIKSQNFSNTSYWDFSTGGSYISDDNWDGGKGKDVYVIKDWDGSDLRIKYLTRPTTISARFEVALNLKWGSDTVDNSNLTIKANLLRNNKITGTLNLEATSQSQLSEYSLDNVEKGKWYVYSAEGTDLVEANSIEFIIHGNDIPDGENIDIYLTKVVVRRSESTSHKLGLSDVLYNVSTAQDSYKVGLVSHRIVLFKNKENGEVIPIQFNNAIKSYAASNTEESYNKYAESGLVRIPDFIKSCSLGKSNENSKLEKLFKPWVRRLYYWELKTDDSQAGAQSNVVLYYKYRVATDSLGVKSRKVLRSPTSDIFTGGSMSYDEATGSISIDDINLRAQNGYLINYNANLQIYSSEPISFEDERFSLLSNCFNPGRYKEGLSTPVAVTNIQLVGPVDEDSNSKEILFEIEYLPIIYDELDHHISINMFLHKRIGN